MARFFGKHQQSTGSIAESFGKQSSPMAATKHNFASNSSLRFNGRQSKKTDENLATNKSFEACA
jgi:hypothetical protein